MAHAKKYHSTFVSRKLGTTETVEIWEDGFVGSSTAFAVSLRSPVKATYGKPNDLFGWHRELNVQVNVHTNETTLLDDLRSGTEEQFQVRHYIGSTLKWIALVNTDGLRRTIGHDTSATIEGHDGIRILKRKGLAAPGVDTPIAHLVSLLNLLGYGVKFVTSNNIFPVSTLVATDDPLENVDIDLGRIQDKLQENGSASAHDLLEAICKRYHLRVSLTDKGWTFENRSEKFNSTQNIYRYTSAGAHDTPFNSTMTAYSFNDVQVGDGSEELFKSYRSARSTYEFGVYAHELLENGDFELYSPGQPAGQRFDGWTLSSGTDVRGSLGQGYGQGAALPVAFNNPGDTTQTRVEKVDGFSLINYGQASTKSIGGSAGDLLRLAFRARAFGGDPWSDVANGEFLAFYSLKFDGNWLNRETGTFDDASLTDVNKIPFLCQLDEDAVVVTEHDVSGSSGTVEVKIWQLVDDFTPEGASEASNVDLFVLDAVKFQFLAGGENVEDLRTKFLISNPAVDPVSSSDELYDRTHYIGDGPHDSHPGRIRLSSDSSSTSEWKLDNGTADGSEVRLETALGRDALRQVVNPLRVINRKLSFTATHLEPYDHITEDSFNYDPQVWTIDYKADTVSGQFVQVRYDALSVDEDITGVPDLSGTRFDPSRWSPGDPFFDNDFRFVNRGLVFAGAGRRFDSNRIYWPRFGGKTYAKLTPAGMSWTGVGGETALVKTTSNSTDKADLAFPSLNFSGKTGISWVGLVRCDSTAATQFLDFDRNSQSGTFYREAETSDSFAFLHFNDAVGIQLVSMNTDDGLFESVSWFVAGFSFEYASGELKMLAHAPTGELFEERFGLTGSYTNTPLENIELAGFRAQAHAVDLVYNTALSSGELRENAIELARYARELGLSYKLGDLAFDSVDRTIVSGAAVDLRFTDWEKPIEDGETLDHSGNRRHGRVVGDLWTDLVPEPRGRGIVKITSSDADYIQVDAPFTGTAGTAMTSGFTAFGLWDRSTSSNAEVIEGFRTSSLQGLSFEFQFGTGPVIILTDEDGVSGEVEFGSTYLSPTTDNPILNVVRYDPATRLLEGWLICNSSVTEQPFASVYLQTTITGTGDMIDDHIRFCSGAVASSVRRFVGYNSQLSDAAVSHNIRAILSDARQYGIDIPIPDPNEVPFELRKANQTAINALLDQGLVRDGLVRAIMCVEDPSDPGYLVDSISGEKMLLDSLTSFTSEGLAITSATGVRLFDPPGSDLSTGGDLSMMYVGKKTGAAATFIPIVYRQDASTNRLLIGIDGTEKVSLTATNDAAGSTTIQSGVSEVDETDFHMIAGTLEGSTGASSALATYWAALADDEDDVLLNVDTGTTGAGTFTANSEGRIQIFDAGDGTLACAFVWNRVLTQTEFVQCARALSNYLAQRGINFTLGTIQDKLEVNSAAITVNEDAIALEVKRVAEANSFTLLNGAHSGTITSLTVDATPHRLYSGDVLNIVYESGGTNYLEQFTVSGDHNAGVTSISVSSNPVTGTIADNTPVATSLVTTTGQIKINADNIALAVVQTEFDEAMKGTLLGRTSQAYNGTFSSINVEGIDGTGGIKTQVLEDQIIVITDKGSGLLWFARVSATAAAGATSISIEDPTVNTATNATLTNVDDESPIHIIHALPAHTRTALHIGLDGIDVEADIFKSNNWDGTWNGTDVTDPGSIGWALPKSGVAVFNGIEISTPASFVHPIPTEDKISFIDESTNTESGYVTATQATGTKTAYLGAGASPAFWAIEEPDSDLYAYIAGQNAAASLFASITVGPTSVSIAADGSITLTPASSSNIILDGHTWPNDTSWTDGFFLRTNASGVLSWAAGAAGMTSFTLAGDTGTQTITDGNTLSVLGSAGIDTVAAATDKVTVSLDLAELTASNDPASTEFVVTVVSGLNRKTSLDRLLSGVATANPVSGDFIPFVDTGGANDVLRRAAIGAGAFDVPVLDTNSALKVDGHYLLKELTTQPGTPATGYVALYAYDNGAGDHTVRVKFDNGNVQTIATRV